MTNAKSQWHGVCFSQTAFNVTEINVLHVNYWLIFKNWKIVLCDMHIKLSPFRKQQKKEKNNEKGIEKRFEMRGQWIAMDIQEQSVCRYQWRITSQSFTPNSDAALSLQFLEPGDSTLHVYRVLPGTSLVVQWLRIFLPLQGTWVQSLVRELRCHIPQNN